MISGKIRLFTDEYKWQALLIYITDRSKIRKIQQNKRFKTKYVKCNLVIPIASNIMRLKSRIMLVVLTKTNLNLRLHNN